MAKYVSLENLDLYDELIKAHIDEQDARSLKTVALDETKKILRFYREDEPIGDASPAYELQLPETDLSGVMAKLVNAVANHVLTVDANGAAKDSGVAISDLATKSYVNEEIGDKIAQAMHMTKKIVTEIPNASDAKENVMYLYKPAGTKGTDKYEIYMLINGNIELIDDTSTDLSDYLTKAQVEDKISTAKNEASSDAATKANSALSDAKAYTDSEVGKLNSGEIKANTDKITSLSQRMESAEDSITEYGDRLNAIELSQSDLVSCTEAEIKALFKKKTS